jgi:hypothetical protein
MTLISTTTLSGVSTTISSIPQTFVNLFIVVSGMTGNTANSRFQLIPNNTANTTDWSITSTSGAADSATNTNIVFDNFQNTLRTGGNNISAITFYDYTTTTQNKQFNANGFLVNGASINSAYNFNGSFKSASALTSLVFNFGGTNTFAGGTVLVYGVK